MKWYSYMWIVVRFLLFCFLYHIIISMIVGMFIGFTLVGQHDHVHIEEMIAQVMDEYLWVGFLSIGLAFIISGFQHFNYYKRRKQELAENDSSKTIETS